MNTSTETRPASSAPYALTPKRAAILLWALVPVLGLLVRAIVSMTAPAMEALGSDLGLVHIVATVAWAVFMAITEGYQGFQRSFSPRVVHRAFALAASPRPVDVVFAPIYAIGYYRAPKRTMVVAWSVTTGVVGLIFAVHQIEQPWRGLIDVGVVVGLAWGMASLVALAVRRLVR
ncbi:MAG: hypothetical protein CSA66_05655 [Proteobacteria bacterium]|nr:MAG: hypothetical protein CSA66_05655 [Pseudomonadota bacterium]